MNGRNVIDTHGAGGWGNEVAQRLICHAARNAPPPLAERLEEEWLADLATRRGQVTRVLFGLGCCWATNVIAREHCALNVSAATAATGSTTMTTQVLPNLTFLPRHTTVLIAIVGLHVAIIYAFATGLAHRLIEPQTPMIADVLRDIRKAPTPAPPPTFNPSHLKIDPMPEPQIIVDVDRGEAIRDVVMPPIADPLRPQRPTPPPVKRVLGGPGKGFPATDDYYPAASIRLGEQGSAAIRVCVDPSGKLTAEPQVMKSSGSSRLDEGAIKLAKAGSGHYRATTENGTPVSSCYGYLITFNLE
ncbi:MAG TPA: energy transducer TonB [Tepidiformaceae bacterium]|nr:energy transducer TonB [Tepidiformaceae bacterium]